MKKTKEKVPQKAKKQKNSPCPQWVQNALNNPVRDYHVYVMTAIERSLYFVLAFVVGGLVSQVFYGGLFQRDGMATTLTHISNVAVFIIVGLVAARFFFPMRNEQLLRKSQLDLRSQFRDMLESITAALSANDTVPQAFDYAWKSMKLQYSENAYIVQELGHICEAISNNYPLIDAIEDLASRSACEDIESFSNVFRACYGPGGNMKEVMRQTHDIICDKMKIEDEIRSKVSANQLELNIITVAPILIVGMLRFSGGSFAENFASPAGVISITVAIILFIVAYRMGQKIVNIKG